MAGSHIEARVQTVAGWLHTRPPAKLVGVLDEVVAYAKEGGAGCVALVRALAHRGLRRLVELLESGDVRIRRRSVEALVRVAAASHEAQGVLVELEAGFGWGPLFVFHPSHRYKGDQDRQLTFLTLRYYLRHAKLPSLTPDQKAVFAALAASVADVVDAIDAVVAFRTQLDSDDEYADDDPAAPRLPLVWAYPEPPLTGSRHLRATLHRNRVVFPDPDLALFGFVHTARLSADAAVDSPSMASLHTAHALPSSPFPSRPPSPTPSTHSHLSPLPSPAQRDGHQRRLSLASSPGAYDGHRRRLSLASLATAVGPSRPRSVTPRRRKASKPSAVSSLDELSFYPRNLRALPRFFHDAESLADLVAPPRTAPLAFSFVRYEDVVVDPQGPRFRRRLSLPSNYKANPVYSLAASVRIRASAVEDTSALCVPLHGPWDDGTPAQLYTNTADALLQLRRDSPRSPRLVYIPHPPPLARPPTPPASEPAPSPPASVLRRADSMRRLRKERAQRQREAESQLLGSGQSGSRASTPSPGRKSPGRSGGGRARSSGRPPSRLRKVFRQTVEKSSEFYAFPLGPMFTMQLGPQAAEYNFQSHSARQRVLAQRTEALYHGHVEVEPFRPKTKWLSSTEVASRLKVISSQLHAPIHDPAQTYEQDATMFDESYDPYASMVGLPPGKLSEPKSLTTPYVSHVKAGSRSAFAASAASSTIKRERPLGSSADTNPVVERSSRDVMMSFQNLLLTPADKAMPFDEADGILLDLETTEHRQPHVASLMASVRDQRPDLDGRTGRRGSTASSSSLGSASGHPRPPPAPPRFKTTAEVFVTHPYLPPASLADEFPDGVPHHISRFNLDVVREKKRVQAIKDEQAAREAFIAAAARKRARAAAAARGEWDEYSYYTESEA